MNEINTTASVDQIEAIEVEEMEQIEQLELPGMPEPIQVELTLEQIVDQILDASGLTALTMYQVAKYLNLVLEAIDATKGLTEEGAPAAYRVRPQMVYNYNRNKMVAKGQVLEQATVAQARAFIIKTASKFVK